MCWHHIHLGHPSKAKSTCKWSLNTSWRSCLGRFSLPEWRNLDPILWLRPGPEWRHITWPRSWIDFDEVEDWFERKIIAAASLHQFRWKLSFFSWASNDGVEGVVRFYNKPNTHLSIIGIYHWKYPTSNLILMYLLGTVCCQPIHQSQIWCWVLICTLW